MHHESDVYESVCEAGVLVHDGRRCRACHLRVCARLQRAQLPLPSACHDDLRENQRRLPPPAIHTIPPPSSELFSLFHTRRGILTPPPRHTNNAGARTSTTIATTSVSPAPRPPPHRMIDIALTPSQKAHTTSPTTITSTSLHTPTSMLSNIRHQIIGNTIVGEISPPPPFIMSFQVLATCRLTNKIHLSSSEDTSGSD